MLVLFVEGSRFKGRKPVREAGGSVSYFHPDALSTDFILPIDLCGFLRLGFVYDSELVQFLKASESTVGMFQQSHFKHAPRPTFHVIRRQSPITEP